MKPHFVLRSETMEELLQEGLEREEVEHKTETTIDSTLATSNKEENAPVLSHIQPIHEITTIHEESRPPVDFVIYQGSSFAEDLNETEIQTPGSGRGRKKKLVHVYDQENKSYTVQKFSWK